MSSSNRRGRACEQRRIDARRTYFNNKTEQSLPTVGFQPDGSYISTNDLMDMMNRMDLTTSYRKFDRILVEEESLQFENGLPLVADSYECTCGDWGAGICAPDFCVKQCTMRRLPSVPCSDLENSPSWMDSIGSMDFSELQEVAQRERIRKGLKRPAVSDHDECKSVEVISASETKIRAVDCKAIAVDMPTQAYEIDNLPVVSQQTLESLGSVELKRTTPVVIPLLISSSGMLSGHKDLLIGQDVQFIYSGPGNGKTTLRRKFPQLVDTDDTYVLPNNSTVLTNRWDLLLRFPKPYHVVHLPSRTVWNQRCKMKCTNWLPTWYDDLSRLDVFFKMKSDRYLSDLLSVISD